MRSGNKKRAKLALTALAAAVLSGALSASAMAQSTPLTRFDNGYLDQHPKVTGQLSANPGLADNPQFLANDPGLGSYLNSHPAVRADLNNHPDRFMDRESRLDHPGAAPLRTTDTFFDNHPELAKQLNRNPALVKNPQFVGSHPGLHEYLQNHPNARTEWRSHPYRYTRRERRYDQNH
jgi:hypothetical protein